MCQQCVELVKKYFPSMPENEYGELLMGATCFPFGGPEMIEPQLIELKKNTNGTLGQCLGFANKQLIESMKKINHKEQP